jgi:regulatory protein
LCKRWFLPRNNHCFLPRAADLKQRGIDNFDLSAYDFFALAKEVRVSKYGKAPPSNYKEKSKQQRFLHSRGFGFDEINDSFE